LFCCLFLFIYIFVFFLQLLFFLSLSISFPSRGLLIWRGEEKGVVTWIGEAHTERRNGAGRVEVIIDLNAWQNGRGIQ
jgi:amino acid transporter